MEVVALVALSTAVVAGAGSLASAVYIIRHARSSHKLRRQAENERREAINLQKQRQIRQRELVRVSNPVSYDICGNKNRRSVRICQDEFVKDQFNVIGLEEKITTYTIVRQSRLTNKWVLINSSRQPVMQIDLHGPSATVRMLNENGDCAFRSIVRAYHVDGHRYISCHDDQERKLRWWRGSQVLEVELERSTLPESLNATKAGKTANENDHPTIEIKFVAKAKGLAYKKQDYELLYDDALIKSEFIYAMAFASIKLQWSSHNIVSFNHSIATRRNGHQRTRRVVSRVRYNLKRDIRTTYFWRRANYRVTHMRNWWLINRGIPVLVKGSQ